MKAKIKNSLLNAMIEIIRSVLLISIFILAFSMAIVALIVSAIVLLPIMSILYMVDKREGISTSIFKAIENWLEIINEFITGIIK